MQQLTVKIPDNKLSFFMELVQSLGFVQVDKSSTLTDQQIELVNIERSKMKNDPSYMLEWEDARKTLKTD
jgi:hypothetical protein